MRILVTGAAGLLGRAAVEDARVRGHEVIALAHGDLDVTLADAVERAVAEHQPDTVLHGAAYTAVDRAEADPEQALMVNRDGTRHVAEAAARCGASFVYISTDYVFDGQKRTPYLPSDGTGPLSVYGRSKLEGERVALASIPSSLLVVRTSWLYGGDSGFVPAILRKARQGERLRVVVDQRGRPTWAPHAAQAVLDLAERGARGTWHVAGGGECTWHELALEALRLSGIGANIEAISTSEFKSAARRPAYSVLDLTATESFLGKAMPHWKEALGAYMNDAPRGTEWVS